MESNFWRKCGSCKKEIPYNSIYQACSVSSCAKFAFCSVDCWDQHNPIMNHKSAWAEEKRAPATGDSEVKERKVIMVSSQSSNPTMADNKEVLIVVSKLKQYVKDKYDLNTSANVMEALSDHVRFLTDKACDKARREGRKTLMDRDF